MQKVFFSVDTNAQDAVMDEPVAAVFGATPEVLAGHVKQLQQTCVDLDLLEVRKRSDLDWLQSDGDMVSAANQAIVVTRDSFWFERTHEHSDIRFWTSESSLRVLDNMAESCSGEVFVPGGPDSEDFLVNSFHEQLTEYQGRIDYDSFAANTVSRIQARDPSAEVNPDFIDTAIYDGLNVEQAVESWFE